MTEQNKTPLTAQPGSAPAPEQKPAEKRPAEKPLRRVGSLTNTVTDEEGQTSEVETIGFGCEEAQHRYRGTVTAEEVTAKFDYWWDIATGKTEEEAEDNEAERNDEPTLIQRVNTLENAFMEFVEEVLNG